ncbi:MAG TPA: universal stress protein [Candidatus Limnocylindria bacterium]|nr:universal stress protein [Candidatus Limnocylindria bacterium]
MRILIGVDGSPASTTACELVASRTWPLGTRVTLLGAVEILTDWTGLVPPSANDFESRREAMHFALEDRATGLESAALAVDTVVESGRAADLLMTRADESFADLIVVGSRGLGPWTSAVMGSVSAELVDHAGCPVLVARSPTFSRMLLASDGTPSSRAIPGILAAWGTAFRGVPVEVLSVAPREGFITPWAIWADDGDDEPESDASLHQAIAEGVADELMELGFHAAAISRKGDASRLIVAESREWGADLIVTGSRGIGTLHRLMGGSVAHDVLMHARSSVLVIRGSVPAPVARAVASVARA